MADNNNSKLHIAMLPWLAFGHLIPFLELAKLIASKGHKISFISTPRNIDRLPQTLDIHFIKLDLPKVENLPHHAESTKDVPFNKVRYLKIAYDGLQTQVSNFLKTSSPDWIMYDFAPYWVGPIAAEHGVRSAFFSVVPSLMLTFLGPPEVAMYGDKSRTTIEDIVNRRPKWVPFENKVRPTVFQLTRNHEYFDAVDKNVSDGYRLGATVRGCDAVVVRSCSDFEPEWWNLLKEVYQKQIIAAGLLPSAMTTEGNSCWLKTKDWLDMHEKSSVIYIAFGTETKPSQYELTQLALGLELSGLPFYWVLIDQRGVSDEVVKLPRGFEDRTRGRGVVCRDWAPQFKILSHDSVGVLLIHSGMSSVVEGLQLGKPLVLLPFTADQGLIGSYLVEKKMACMIDRGEVDGSFTPESVADSLSLVMASEEGKIYREKAEEMKGLFGDGNLQDKCVDELIHFLHK